MSSRSAPIDDEFLSVASRRSLISSDVARELQAESRERGVPAAHLVMEKGLLTPVDVDLVQTLAQPHAAIEGYEILELLGRGGMGLVYRAVQKNLQRTVALKTVLLSQTAFGDTLARFEQEARVVGRLQHPNIVAAYDFGRHRGRLFFAMELVEGENLEQRIVRLGRLSEAESWGLAYQAAAGLAHAASQGIVHRDIKPANLLLVAPQEGLGLPAGLPMVKITDFGLAFLNSAQPGATRLTSSSVTLGTPHYMAPEQFENASIDLRTDIYALGATVFHMLTGQAPFQAKTLSQLMGQKLHQGAPAPGEWSQGLNDATVELISQMMARLPSDRIGDYATLLNRIQSLPPSISVQGSGQPLLQKPRSSGGFVSQPTASMAPTQAFVAEPRAEPAHALAAALSRRRRWVALGLAAVLTLASCAGWVGYHAWVSGQKPVASLVAGDYTRYLYNGKNLSGWTTQDGSWVHALDDGTRVLAGRGSIKRKLPGTPGFDHYRLSLLADARSATALELQFALVPQAGGVSCGVVRLESGRAALGQRDAAGKWIKSLGVTVPLATADATLSDGNYHALRVERQASHWFAWCDEQLLGTIPIGPSIEAYEFRLVSEAAQAYFSDVEFSNLVPERIPTNRAEPGGKSGD